MPYNIIKNKDGTFKVVVKDTGEILSKHTQQPYQQIKAIEISKKGRKNPELWEYSKNEAIRQMGKHSARAMQLAGRIYRFLGGEYTKSRTKAQKDLTKWTLEDWTTKSGLQSSITGERYLPKKIIENLSDTEYNKTTKAKQKGTKEGKQYVKQPEEIIKKIKTIKEEDKHKKVKIGNHKYVYYISEKPNKKLKVYVNNKWIHFGQNPYHHYKDRTGLLDSNYNHLDEDRRKRYLNRASKIRNKEGELTALNPESPNYHAINILW